MYCVSVGWSWLVLRTWWCRGSCTPYSLHCSVSLCPPSWADTHRNSTDNCLDVSKTQDYNITFCPTKQTQQTNTFANLLSWFNFCCRQDLIMFFFNLLWYLFIITEAKYIAEVYGIRRIDISLLLSGKMITFLSQTAAQLSQIIHFSLYSSSNVFLHTQPSVLCFFIN